jgi:hypothetical protein
LKPETKLVKLMSVATSRKYPVAPDAADQFAVREVDVTSVAEVAVGGNGAVSCEPDVEFILVPPALVALSR